MNGKDIDEIIETAYEYALAVCIEFGDGETVGYFQHAPRPDLEHEWFRATQQQSRWGIVTEQAVRNAIETARNSGEELRLREPDALLAEIES